MDMFSEIDGFRGESKYKTHAKQIDVLPWSWGMRNNCSADVGREAAGPPVNEPCNTSSRKS